MPSTEHNCIAIHRNDPDRQRRAADGLQLCRGCVEGMRRHLKELPALYEEVVESMPTRPIAGGAHVSGSREPGLPFNPAAGELSSQIEYDLRVRSTRVARERGLLPPLNGSVPSVCAWLGRHVDWMCAQPEAAEIRDHLIELTGRAWGVIDPDRRPVELGRCVETVDGELCEGYLYASVLDVDDPRPSKIWCDSCPLVMTSEQWYRFGRRYHVRLAAIERAEKERIAS